MTISRIASTVGGSETIGMISIINWAVCLVEGIPSWGEVAGDVVQL